MRRLSALILLLTIWTGAATQASAQTSSPVARLYAACLAGDYGAISDRLQTQADYLAIKSDLLKQMAAWSKDASRTWAPSRAEFALEVARVVYAYDVRESAVLLTTAQQLIIHRPGALGVNPAADRFEVTYHRSAIAILSFTPLLAEFYLSGIDRRIDPLSRLPGLAAGSTRLALDRAVVKESRTAPLARDSSPPEGDRKAQDDDRLLRLGLNVVLNWLGDVPQTPDTSAEIHVRRAFVLHRLGRHKDAVMESERGLAETRDPYLIYLASLVRGRASEANGDAPGAIRSYERAAAIWPQAQTAAVALASLLMRQGDREAAVRWAGAARTMPDDSVDPWWYYWSADGRFLPDLLTELRGARP